MSIPKVDLELARQTLRSEGQAILDLAALVDESFSKAASMIYECSEQVVLTGIGKAGLIGRKISATFASTGTRSIFLHPVEALHGDLGRLRRGDLVVALSHSGSTEEIVSLVDHIKGRGANLIAITSSVDSPLGQYSDVTIAYGQVEEACPHKLAPTVSTSCMLALGDALALTVMQMGKFSPEDFAAFHPAGELGRKLLKVEDAMIVRTQDDRLKVFDESMTLGDALAGAEEGGRRVGAMLLVGPDKKLSGILTDADLRRAIVSGGGTEVLGQPVSNFMGRDPRHVHLGDLASKALAIINEYRIDELPVLNDKGKPVGVIDVQDLIGIKTVNDDATSS